MAAKQVNPTRMELTRLKKKRITAIRGHKLLKDKRDELMRQYLDLVRENMEVRLRVEEGILSANRNFVIARAGMSEAALNTALGHLHRSQRVSHRENVRYSGTPMPCLLLRGTMLREWS